MWNRMLLIGGAFFGTTVAAQAQFPSFNDMLKGESDLASQMKQLENKIVQANLNNPQVKAMYQKHRAQGGTLSPQEFAYQYAATGGFTPQGKLAYFNNNNANTQRIQQTWQGLQTAQQNSAQALANWQAGFANIQKERGNLLQGNSSYYHPGTGQTYVLPHNVAGGTITYNPATGQHYRVDNLGNYSVYYNGVWQPLNKQ